MNANYEPIPVIIEHRETTIDGEANLRHAIGVTTMQLKMWRLRSTETVVAAQYEPTEYKTIGIHSETASTVTVEDTDEAGQTAYGFDAESGQIVKTFQATDGEALVVEQDPAAILSELSYILFTTHRLDQRT